jgi:replicative DNA helicase
MLTGMIAEILKNAAEQLAIPVVLGSQVSRDFKGREDKRPRLEDIRNSGEIEEKANQILVLHRPNERQEGADREKIEVYLEKNTSGSIGKTEVWHRLGWFRFESAAREQDVDYEF